MNYLQEHLQHQQDLIKSIEYCVDRTTTPSITGVNGESLIKSLENKVEEITPKLIKEEKGLALLQKAIEETPQDTLKKGESVCQKFNHSQIYTEKSTDHSKSKYMRLYNKTAIQSLEKSEILNKLTHLIDSIDENKTYKLPKHA